MLRQWKRQPDKFKRFESRLFLRVIVIIAGGGALVALLHRADCDGAALILLAIVLAASLYSASRLRGRNETSAGYKHRVGYREPEQHNKGEVNER